MDLTTEIKKRRSFAIIAHPDAGKTTLTEKLLLYGGAIQLAGHVRAKKDRKKTKSDWMTLEQERGISVSTAAMQFEYNGHILNLLDTPGHEDFSEDTYRTLMAVDCAIMLLDAGKGVEPQTIKLFQICRSRNIPIVTLINKMDMPARDPFDLLDEVEKVLGIEAVPMLWPIGSGRDFKGVYHIANEQVYLFERTTGGAYRAPVKMKGLDDPELQSIVDEDLYSNFREGIDLAIGALPEFQLSNFQNGKITPVYFGSALTNFGIELFLNEFLQISPSPDAIKLQDGSSLPTTDQFAAFVFKLQANMNKAHRDRVAFVRIASGQFERGMTVYINDKKKTAKLSSPVSFFGQDRSTIDSAFPGDIIGLINPGLFSIGDILFTGELPKFHPMPRFAPEMFARLIVEDTSKMKGFRKGIAELAEEGVVQVFTREHDASPVIGAVGILQFEVFRFRIQDEYGAPCRLETLGFECSRWIRPADKSKFSSYDLVLNDDKGNPVVLFKSEFRMQSFMREKPDVPLFESPHLVD
ncbi:MAG: peptide chain release factor 3 [Leptonema sp. (in: Bacteria)]|nr:peptide chain release factor 3 [Leptonema sp. (in: bacteria)]